CWPARRAGSPCSWRGCNGTVGRMEVFPNGPGSSPRILLLGGTSEIGLAILSALAAPAQTQVILAGRDEQRLAAAGKQLPHQVRTHAYDATETDAHQAFADAILADGPLDMVISAAGSRVPPAHVEPGLLRARPARRSRWARPRRPGCAAARRPSGSRPRSAAWPWPSA